MTFRFLGTGTSVGVPQIGCECPVCTSTDPRDKRRRCGAYVTSKDGAFLIDTPPELREACLAYKIRRVDDVLLTHAHMDHVADFDDIRRFNTLKGGVIDCYALPETIEQMHRIFPYISERAGTNGLFRPQIRFVDNTQPFTVAGLRVEALRVEHSFPCCGYLIDGRLGYISDCHDLPDETVARLAGVEVMILNCLRVRDHATHLNLERALGYLERIRPRKTYLIHMCHDISHARWLELLPPGIEPAYDGLEITL